MESTDNLKCEDCGGTASWKPEKYGHSRGSQCANIRCGGRLYPSSTKTVIPEMILPADSAGRKDTPITTGVLDYFPLAIAAVARLSKKGNDKHNPGQPLHWSRDKSTDHENCIPRHLVDRGVIDPDTGELHEVSLAWRALALLELAEEKRLGKPMSRGSR